MAPVTRSGHARLKAALVLREALAAELGVDLGLAMTALRNVEEALGAPRGLAEGKYLEALGSVSTADSAGLASLDGEVRQACDQVRFSPRYAQFLALILFAHWARARREDPAAFLDRLNAFLAAHKPKGETIAPFEAADLQVAAFWMATAAGKTHVLHVCLALLDRPGAWDRVLIVTPSEALTRQHADKLRALAAPGRRRRRPGPPDAGYPDRSGHQDAGQREKGRWRDGGDLGVRGWSQSGLRR